LRRRQPLVAEKDDLVLEESTANFVLRKILREIDPEELCAERAGEASDFQRPTRP